jgi:hypothetical protein
MMKKLHKILLTVGLGVLSTSSIQADLLKEAAALDVNKVCDVKANGIDAVLATAAKYNAEAVKQGVEFKRLGVTNSNYIKTTTAAAKAKQKEVVLEYKKKGKVKKQKMATDYAAWRACSFAIRGLQQKVEAEDTWRLAVPGDGFKY